MRRSWTSDEINTLLSLSGSTTQKEIADKLGRSAHSIYTKLSYLKRPHFYRAKERARCASKNPYERAVKDLEILEGRPSEAVLHERNMRLSSPYRDLTGWIFGDPRIGYSALDRF